MTDHSDTTNSPLPLSYRLTIILSVGLMFALGLAYFGLRNQRVPTSFQIYGSPTAVQGLPAVFRLVHFDNDGNQGNLPVQIVTVTVSQNGSVVANGTPLQEIATVPADARIDTATLVPGPAMVRFEVSGWEGESRTLEFPLEVLAPDDAAPMAATLRPGIEAPIDGTRARMDLSLPSGGMVEGLPNRLWVRFADPASRPQDVHPTYRLGSGEEVRAAATGRLGITPMTLVPSGPNQTLFIDVPFRDDTVSWEEMVAPGKLARLDQAPLFVTQTPPVLQHLRVATDGADRVLYCSLWFNTTVIELARVDTIDGIGNLAFSLPHPGLYWATCDDHFLSASEFLAERPMIVTEDPLASLNQLLQLGATEPFFSHWPASHLLTAEELERASAYLQDRLAPAGQQTAQLLNTYDGDVAQLRARAENQRDTVLLLWAIAGVGLLLWAVAVTIRQHKRLARSFQEFQEGEDVGDDLATQGITRKRSFVPAALVAVAVLANLGALIWLLRLIFF